MKPTVGRIVHYFPTEDEQQKMFIEGNRQSVLPAMVVAVWSGSLVNLKVFCDSMSDDLWKTSVSQVDTSVSVPEKGTVATEGKWDWPVKEE